MLEKEYKVLLREKDYNRLIKLYEWEDEFTQVNYYYIDEMRKLSDMDISVRVRLKKGRMYLQVKTPVDLQNALHIKQEFEQELFSLPDYISSSVLSGLTGMELPDVTILGRLTTERKIKIQGTAEIALDKNSYMGDCDYELEIEYTGESPDFLLEELKVRGFSLDSSSVGKYARFIQKYDKSTGL